LAWCSWWAEADFQSRAVNPSSDIAGAGTGAHWHALPVGDGIGAGVGAGAGAGLGTGACWHTAGTGFATWLPGGMPVEGMGGWLFAGDISAGGIPMSGMWGCCPKGSTAEGAGPPPRPRP
jgi:hypothetical protein